MDIGLPGIDGVEAFRRIKAASPGIPVLMMTGYPVEDLISQALEQGGLAGGEEITGRSGGVHAGSFFFSEVERLLSVFAVCR